MTRNALERARRGRGGKRTDHGRSDRFEERLAAAPSDSTVDHSAVHCNRRVGGFDWRRRRAVADHSFASDHASVAARAGGASIRSRSARLGDLSRAGGSVGAVFAWRSPIRISDWRLTNRRLPPICTPAADAIDSPDSKRRWPVHWHPARVAIPCWTLPRQLEEHRRFENGRRRRFGGRHVQDGG